MSWKLAQPLSFNARHYPDAIASSFEGRRQTWAGLRDRVAAAAGGLTRIGVAASDRIGILADNGDLHWEAALAVWWAGGAINPVNIRWSASEMAYSLDDCDTRVLIVGAAYAHLVPELRRLSTALEIVVELEHVQNPESIGFEDLVGEQAPIADAARGGADLAGIFYTGGTTGFPKGVALTHDAIAANTLINLLEMPLDRDDVVLTVAPMFHLGGLCIVLRALFGGATCVFVRSFEERAFLEAARSEGATYTLLLPVMIQRLLDSGEDVAAALQRLRLVQYGASPIGEALLRRFADTLPHVGLVQSYGMTEMSGPFTILPSEAHRALDGSGAVRLRSAGRAAIGVDLRVVREDGSTAAEGEIGEVMIRGPSAMQGYWNRPDLTAAALRDGWVHSGDVGHMDADGYLYLVDRLKDMIVSGGENVYSAEVENAIAKHPAVAACAVIGIPSERWGEQVHAVVVLHASQALDATALRDHCKTLIAGYKCPVSVEFRQELLYTGTGKLQKNVLREAHWRGANRQVG